MITATTQIAWNQLTAITEGKGSTRKIGQCLGMKVPGTKFSFCFRAYIFRVEACDDISDLHPQYNAMHGCVPFGESKNGFLILYFWQISRSKGT